VGVPWVGVAVNLLPSPKIDYHAKVGSSELHSISGGGGEDCYSLCGCNNDGTPINLPLYKMDGCQISGGGVKIIAAFMAW